MKESSGRLLRVADFVREELTEIIRREMRDPRVGMLSITDVRVSRDLSYADVYVSSLEASDAEDQVELVAVLTGASGFLRSMLARSHSMRTTPKLRFHYDELIQEGSRMQRLIDQAVRDDETRARQAGTDESPGTDEDQDKT